MLTVSNRAYNKRRQHIVQGSSPDKVLRDRLDADPAQAKPAYNPPSPSLIRRALQVVNDATEVSKPHQNSEPTASSRLDQLNLIALNLRPRRHFEYLSAME